MKRANDIQPPAAATSSTMACCRRWLWASASGLGTGRLFIAGAKSGDFTTKGASAVSPLLFPMAARKHAGESLLSSVGDGN
jgi:hypothetical protein